ncbi:hypothetical protein BT69DRAFT_1277949 [Atractiella rhizophila]|nr:hypothetical protein BT69DRAFT_1277949 [Atractiella rhizophila]
MSCATPDSCVSETSGSYIHEAFNRIYQGKMCLITRITIGLHNCEVVPQNTGYPEVFGLNKSYA